MNVVGIDPGNSGAIVDLAVVGDKLRYAAVFDMPLTKTPGKKNKIDPEKLVSIIKHCKQDNTIFVLEQVNASPNQGTVSAFTFGVGYGLIVGAVLSVGADLVLVRPQEWKRYHGLIGSAKDDARAVCTDRYPDFGGEFLARKKDVDRADALLIAEYGWHKHIRITLS